MTYSPNGGTGNNYVVEVTYGQPFVCLDNTDPHIGFTKKGHSFSHWIGNDGSNWNGWVGRAWTWAYAYDVIMYAQWSPNTYTVKYDANGGSGTMSDTTVKFGENITISANTYTRVGYTYDRWLEQYPDGMRDYGWTGWSGQWQWDDGDYSITNRTLTLYASWTLNESYLRKDWQTALTNNNANFTQANIKTIQFVNTVPSGSGYTQVSVGATTSAGTTAYASGTAGVSDIIAYVKANSSDSTKYDVIFYSPVTIYAPVNSTYLFSNSTYSNTLKNLTSISFGNFETSKVTDMGAMFYYCSSLTSLNLLNFNTSNVTSMIDMFWGCKALTSLNVLNFNTGKVTNMRSMFEGCSYLTSLNVTNFNTSNVTRMSSMFYGCIKLTSLNLLNFNTSNVTNMEYMFYNCSSLTSLNLSSFDMSKVANTTDMFKDCSKLTEIKTPSAIGSTNITIPNNDWYNTSTLSGPYSSITSSLTGITIKRGCYTFTGTNVRAYRSASVVGASTGYISSGGLIYYGDTVDLIANIGYAYYGSQSYLCYQTTTATQWTNYGSNFISLDYTTRVRSGETIASGLTVGGNILAEGTRSYSWQYVSFNYSGSETGIQNAGSSATLSWTGLDQTTIGSFNKISQFVSNGAKVRVNVRVTFGSKNNQSGSASRWIELGNSTTLNPVHASWTASITVSVSTSGVSFSFRDMGLYYSYGYIDSIQVWV